MSQQLKAAAVSCTPLKCCRAVSRVQLPAARCCCCCRCTPCLPCKVIANKLSALTDVTGQLRCICCTLRGPQQAGTLLLDCSCLLLPLPPLLLQLLHALLA